MCRQWDVSIRRACRVFLCDASTYHYKSRRSGQAALDHRIKEICQTRVRYGYRRVHMLLRREGWTINVKKVHRIYRKVGLQFRDKRRNAGSRPSCARIARMPPSRTRLGPWTSYMISWRRAGRSGY